MKIGIITDRMDMKSPGGIGRYTQYLVKNLLEIDKKNQYTLIHTRSNDNELYKKAKEIVTDKIKIPFPKTFKNSIALSLVPKGRFDLVHEPCQMGFYFPVKFKKVVTVHDITPVLFPQAHGLWTKIVYKLFFKKSLRAADLIITDSNNTKTDLVNVLGINEEKIRIVYLGVDPSYKIIKNSESVREKYGLTFPYIIYVGTMEPRKNIPNLIKAFHLLKKNGFEHKLVIVGKKGWKYDEIFSTITSLGINDQVVFLGHVSEDLPKLYNEAAVLAYPSIYEGFGLPPLEAMACGTPVVTSNSSSLPEVVADAALTVDPSDHVALFSALQQVLSDESLRKRLIDKGLKRSKLFSWNETAKQTLNVYNELEV